jgi:hypothetical protein
MRHSEDPIDLLLHEWTLCDAGLARYDTLAFNIRTWVVTVVGAAFATSLTTDHWRIAAPLVLLLSLACWWTDGLHRTLQDQYMARATEIQIELQKSLEASNQSEYLRRFMIEREWIGPMFAAVHKETRDVRAIAHMAWQPHIRWFYAPLSVTALATSLIAAAKPVREASTIAATIKGYELIAFILSVVFVSVCVVICLVIRKVRVVVDDRRGKLREEAEAARDTRLRSFTPTTAK